MAAKKKKGPSLSVGRGEKLPVSKGAGLTAMRLLICAFG